VWPRSGFASRAAGGFTRTRSRHTTMNDVITPDPPSRGRVDTLLAPAWTSWWLVAAGFVTGCGSPSDGTSDNVMTEARHVHYHVHGAGVDHGHTHPDFVNGGHTHEHGNHDR